MIIIILLLAVELFLQFAWKDSSLKSFHKLQELLKVLKLKRIITKVAPFHQFQRLGIDEVENVLEFLDIADLGRLTCTGSYGRELAKNPRLWEKLRQRGPIELTVARRFEDSRRECLWKLYLFYKLEYTFFSKYGELCLARQAMPKAYTNKMDLASDICRFSDIAVSYAISQFTKGRLANSMLVQTPEDARVFRRTTGYKGSVVFLAMNTIQIEEGYRGYDRPEALKENEGFIGYAIDLLQLDPAKEHLRNAFLTLFQNLSVWRSTKDIIEARNNRKLPRHVKAIAVDQVFETTMDSQSNVPFNFDGKKTPNLSNAQQLRKHIEKLEFQVRELEKQLKIKTE